MLNPKHEAEALAVGLKLLSNSSKKGYKLYQINSCGHTCELQVTHVRANNFKCSTCIEEKYKVSANEHGIKYIGYSSLGKQYRLYELSCSHKQDLKPGHVKNGAFRCSLCQEEKIIQEAKDAGLTVKSLSNKGTNYRIFQLPCGHEQEIRQDHVRDKKFKCNSCAKITRETLLHDRGIEFVEFGADRNTSIYKFSKCGHQQEIQISSIKLNTFRCDTCNNLKYHREAKSAGITLVSDTPLAGYKLYKLSCGHEQQIQTVHVRRKWFACKICGDHWAEPNGLYLLHMICEDGFEWLKIGTAKYMSARKTSYQFKKEVTVSELGYIDASSRFVADRMEKALQKKFSDIRISKTVMKEYMGNGHSECFDIYGYEQISAEFENIKNHSTPNINISEKRKSININNEKRKLREICGLIPWEHGNVLKNRQSYEMWKKMPEIHALWVRNNKPGRIVLERLMSEKFEIKCHVKSMLDIFKNKEKLALMLKAHEYFFR